MRPVATVLLLAAASLGAAMSSGSDASAPRVAVGRDISVRLPPGWHLVQNVLGTNHSGPSRSPQAGVIASFAVRFGRHPCPCAHPNYRTCGQWCEETSIRNFPSWGAILFVWEFPVPRDPALLGRGFVVRPGRFRVVPKDVRFGFALGRALRHLHRHAGHACVDGPGAPPTWWSDFVEAGHAFQLEVYLGPAAGSAMRHRLDALLDSTEITPA